MHGAHRILTDEAIKEKDDVAWFQDNKVYFSPNTKHPATVPPFHPPTWDPKIHELQLDFFFTPQWYRRKMYAWLCMVLRAVEPSQHGSVFEAFKDYNLPMTAEKIDKGCYIVPQELQQHWMVFEN